MGSLHLIGTCHLDLKGPERLRKFLKKVKPDKIYLEATDGLVSKVLAKREMREQELKQKKAVWKRFLDLFKTPKKEDILTVVNEVSCYEVWVPYEYQKENPSVKLHPIQDELFYDLYSFSFAQKYYKEFFNAKFKKIGRESGEFVLGVIVDDAYCDTKVDEPDMFMSVIDELFARKIRTLYNPKECAVFVCGQAHIFNNPDNVYDRLRDLKPSRLKLPDAGNF